MFDNLHTLHNSSTGSPVDFSNPITSDIGRGPRSFRSDDEQYAFTRRAAACDGNQWRHSTLESGGKATSIGLPLCACLLVHYKGAAW